VVTVAAVAGVTSVASVSAVIGVIGVVTVFAVARLTALIAVSAVGRLSPVALVVRGVRLRMLIVRMVLVGHRPLLSPSLEPYTPQGYKDSLPKSLLHHTRTFGTSRWTPVPR
jgi:hypothetical protein